jgi:peptide/nickel transport system substrate-binding protein
VEEMLHRVGRTMVVFMLVALVVFPLAQGAPTFAAAQAQQVFNVAMLAESDFVDPHVAASVGFIPIEHAYESLVYMDRGTIRLVPVLAESFTVSSGNTLYTFKLRKGVKFHDGTTMDAEAVKFSYDRLLKVNKGPSWMFSHIESVSVN